MRCTNTDEDVLSLVRQLPRGTSVSIAGHSLGAAVATLLAADIAANAPEVDLTLYTYASPRVGDGHSPHSATLGFRYISASSIVRISFRGLQPLYDATGTEIELDSTAFPVVAHRIVCYHTLTTYLWLLNRRSEFGLGTCRRADDAVAWESA